MKVTIILTLLIMFFGFNFQTQAQVFATTSNGEQVILNKDGTWKQIDTASSSVFSLARSFYATSLIRNNEKTFSKSGNATHLIKSKKLPIGFYVNNKYWGMRRGEINDLNEFYFFNKVDEAYSYMSVDATEGLSIENMRENILRAVRHGMPDATVKKCEYRTVNNLKILYTDIIGNIDNYKAELLYYTYVSEKGAVHVIVSNTQEKFAKFRDVYEDFLNGLTLLDK